MSNPKLPSRAYRITWVWAQEPDGIRLVDEVEATTVPRALSKLMDRLSAEYANAGRDVRVLAAEPRDGF